MNLLALSVEPKDIVVIAGAVIGLLVALVVLAAWLYHKWYGEAQNQETEDFLIIRRSADGYKLLYEQSATQYAVLKADYTSQGERLLRAEAALLDAKNELEASVKQNGKLLAKIDAQDEQIELQNSRISALEAALGIKREHAGG
jgi:hypothetical protein